MTLKHQIKETKKFNWNFERRKKKENCVFFHDRVLKGKLKGRKSFVTCNNHKFLCELIFHFNEERIMKIRNCLWAWSGAVIFIFNPAEIPGMISIISLIEKSLNDSTISFCFVSRDLWSCAKNDWFAFNSIFLRLVQFLFCTKAKSSAMSWIDDFSN